MTLLLVVLLSALSWALADDHFNEAPMLAELVAAGELPPVEERIPANPFVRQVVDEIGVYGGTMRMWADGSRNAYFNLYGLNFNNDMGGYGFDNPLDLVQYVEDGFGNRNSVLAITGGAGAGSLAP